MPSSRNRVRHKCDPDFRASWKGGHWRAGSWVGMMSLKKSTFREPNCPCGLSGGCIDDTILSRQGFIDFAKLPSLDLLQRELVGGLTCLVAQTCYLLQHQPAQLTSLLDQYVRQQHEDESATPASGKPPPPDPAPEP